MWEPFLLQIMKEVLIDLRSGAKNSAFLLLFQNKLPSLQCSTFESGDDVRQPIAVGIFCAYRLSI